MAGVLPNGKFGHRHTGRTPRADRSDAAAAKDPPESAEGRRPLPSAFGGSMALPTPRSHTCSLQNGRECFSVGEASSVRPGREAVVKMWGALPADASVSSCGCAQAQPVPHVPSSAKQTPSQPVRPPALETAPLRGLRSASWLGSWASQPHGPALGAGHQTKLPGSPLWQRVRAGAEGSPRSSREEICPGVRRKHLSSALLGSSRWSNN